MVGFPGGELRRLLKDPRTGAAGGLAMQLFTFIYSSARHQSRRHGRFGLRRRSPGFGQLLKVQEAEGGRYNESLVGKIVRCWWIPPQIRGRLLPGPHRGKHHRGGCRAGRAYWLFVDVKIQKALNWAVSGEIISRDSVAAEAAETTGNQNDQYVDLPQEENNGYYF